jgi:hypothetical protein
MLARVAQKLAGEVPECSNWAYAAQAAAILTLGTPGVGLMSHLIQPASVWMPGGLFIPQATFGILTVSLSSLIVSKLAVNNQWGLVQRRRSNKKLEISLGGMTFTEPALFTNIITFGAIGAGKTAAVVYPILESITALYKNVDPKEPDAKWGGFVLDVKGDFHEALIFVMQKHGRDLLEDLVVIRPDNDYYLLEFEEITTGEHFLVSCMGGTSMQECDLVLEMAVGPKDVLATDESGNKILLLNGGCEALSSYMFSDRGTFLRPEVHARLTQLEFDVAGKSIRWLGWREHNGQLSRVSHTQKRQPVFVRDAQGDIVTCDKPKSLRYCGVHSINNGLTYNLVPRGAASTEAAGRIMSVAEVTGNSFGSDNAYWSQASEKHIAHCIELFRQVEGPLGRECSVNEIQRFTSNEQFLKEYLNRLKDVIRTKQAMGTNDYEILLLRNLEDYFVGEWMAHDPKTKGNITSCVTNLFGDVTRNAQLLKTFCQPSRFSFEDCLNNGKVYTLVLSAYPNAQMLIGTCMKLEFQQVVLRRTQAAPVNKSRFLLFLADEYQFFITTSGGSKSGGDEKFLSLSRQSRILNLVCTQAKTSLLAVQRDENKIDAFIQCFGSRVFLQGLDEKTNKLAEATMGQIWAEREDFQGHDLKLSSAVDGRAPSITRRKEKQHRFDASYFYTQMAPFDAVLFNKEAPDIRQRIVKTNLRKTACFYDKKDLAAAANDYYQAYIENRAWQLGIPHVFDGHDNVKPTDPTEREQRAKGILRSWRNNLPVGLPVSGASFNGAASTVAASESEDVSGSATDVTEEAAKQIMQELGAPKPEDLYKYVDQNKTWLSDLEASQKSDPFYSPEDDKITVPVAGDVAETPPDLPTSDFDSDSSGIEKMLESMPAPKGAEKSVCSEQARRIFANLTDVPDELQNPNGDQHARQ